MSGALFVSTRSTRRSSHELRVTIFASSRSPGGSLPMLYAATAPDVHGGTTSARTHSLSCGAIR